MPTRPLPPGTCNGSVNLPVPEWQQFSRLAFMSGESAGARLRRLIRGDLSAAKARGLQLVKDARQMVMPFAAGVIVFFGFAATAWTAVCGAQELRRPAPLRVAATVRTIKVIGRRAGSLGRPARRLGRPGELDTDYTGDFDCGGLLG